MIQECALRPRPDASEAYRSWFMVAKLARVRTRKQRYKLGRGLFYRRRCLHRTRSAKGKYGKKRSAGAISKPDAELEKVRVAQCALLRTKRCFDC